MRPRPRRCLRRAVSAVGHDDEWGDFARVAGAVRTVRRYQAPAFRGLLLN
jgi:hypothetical protein